MTGLKKYSSLVLAFLVWSGGSIMVFSQTAAEKSTSLTHEETIARALTDLRSDNVDTRVGSIMLLGKYQNPIALEGVVQGLSDKHVRVRRAALVSLIEIQTGMPPNAVEAILLLLNDEDAEIRRMVSSSLAMLVNMWNTYYRGNQLIPIRPTMPLVIQQRFINAFVDEDVVVRRNMLSYYFFLGIQLPETILLSLLEDADDMVRLEALRLTIRINRYPTVIKKAEQLVVDPVQSIRLLLANMLGNERTTGALQWLEILLKDKDPEVVNEAELSLFRMQPTFKEAQRLTEAVMTGRFNEEQGITFIRTLPILLDSAHPIVDRLLESGNPSYRLEALRIFLGFANIRADWKRILELADDKSERVRQQVLNFLRASREPVPVRLIEGLAYARNEQVRETALTLTRHFDNEDAEPLLLDFLIDEEPRLRMLALDELVRRSAADVRETLHLSLEDDNWMMQRRAVTHLIGLNDPEELNYLKARVDKNPEHPLSLYIKDQMLKRLGVQL